MTLRISSYNSRGHGAGRLSYIKKLLEHCEIVLLQEHWYFDDDIQRMSKYIGDVSVYGSSGMPNNELLAGRPYGGCAIIVKNTVKCRAIPIVSTSKRVFACIIDLYKIKILLINVYMPCDEPTLLSAFTDTLSAVETLMSSHNDINHIVLGVTLIQTFRGPHLDISDHCMIF